LHYMSGNLLMKKVLNMMNDSLHSSTLPQADSFWEAMQA
jgi:hypothetical protein